MHKVVSILIVSLIILFSTSCSSIKEDVSNQGIELKIDENIDEDIENANEEHTVTYIFNDKVIATETVKNGEKAPNIPFEDPNYTFFGWTTEAYKDVAEIEYDKYVDFYKFSATSHAEYFNFDSEITYDLKLYADVIECSDIKLISKVTTHSGEKIEAYDQATVAVGNFLSFGHGTYLMLYPLEQNLEIDNSTRFYFSSDDPSIIDYAEIDGYIDFFGKKEGTTNVTLHFGDKSVDFSVKVVPSGSTYAGDNGGAMIPD